VLVAAEPAKIPVPQPGSPNGPGHGVAFVVNIQVKFAANALPNWFRAPVVIVAV